MAAVNVKVPQTPADEMQMFYIPPMSAEEEDALIHTRLTNDERPLRRTTRRFHTYFNTAYTPIIPQILDPNNQNDQSGVVGSVEEARETFLVELAAFEMVLRKSRMVCEAERRQVEEYGRENARIAQEHVTLREEIEQLKTGLEDAQIERRQKIEYDQVAEKINTLPTRQELELSIAALENDLQAIHAEHETQNKLIQMRKFALDAIVSELRQLKNIGREEGDASAAASPAPDADTEMSVGEDGEGADKGEGGAGDSGVKTTLNPHVKPFQPRAVSASSASLLHTALRNSASRAPTPFTSPMQGSSQTLPSSHSKSRRASGQNAEEAEEGEEEEDSTEDIEMGEVSESENRRAKKEDREEGEASDEGSETSEHPNS